MEKSAPAQQQIEVELDSRNRLPMARIVDPDDKRFRIIKIGDGNYLLQSMVSISREEWDCLNDPEWSASIRRALEQARDGKVVRHEPGYWQKLAEELEADED